MPTRKVIEGKTPNGGVRAVLVFSNDEWEPVDERIATRVEIHEYDAKGEVIFRTYGHLRHGEEIAMKLFKRTGGCFQEVAQQRFADEHYESHLEEWIYSNPQLIADDLMIIGRQVVTDGLKRMDLLAVNRSGDTVIIELKRGDSPRDLQAQIDEYLSTVEGWSELELEQRTKHAPRTLQREFREHFKCEPPAQFNTRQSGVVVVEKIDETSLRTFKRHGTRVLQFSYLKTGDEEYLLVDDLSVGGAARPPIRKHRLRESGSRGAGSEQGTTIAGGSDFETRAFTKDRFLNVETGRQRARTVRTRTPGRNISEEVRAILRTSSAATPVAVDEMIATIAARKDNNDRTMSPEEATAEVNRRLDWLRSQGGWSIHREIRNGRAFIWGYVEKL